jgi:hypothetical protein
MSPLSTKFTNYPKKNNESIVSRVNFQGMYVALKMVSYVRNM